jgi:hypothetical protein
LIIYYFEKWKVILNQKLKIKVSNEKGGGKKPEKGLHKYHQRQFANINIERTEIGL